MFNKKSLLKIWLFVSFLAWFGISFTSAATFRLSLDTEGMLYSSRLSYIHFGDYGNDFGWFFYFSNSDNYSPDNAGTKIMGWSDEDGDNIAFNCDKAMKWFYYNSERWERLWPLDIDTFENWGMGGDGLTFTWWLYTLCVKDWYDDFLTGCRSASESLPPEEAEEYYNNCINEWMWAYLYNNSFYWSIKHTYQGHTYWLVAWVKYSTGDRWISIKERNLKAVLAPTFQRLEGGDNGEYAVWLIYDYNWWVGLVWCELTDIDSKTNDGSSALKIFVNELSSGRWAADFFVYTGGSDGYLEVVDLSLSGYLNCRNVWSVWNSLIWMIVDGIVGMSNESKAGIIWNQTNSKMQYFSSSNINNATLINYVKERAGVLCRWKWNDTNRNDRVVCVENANVDAYASNLLWKTLIVRNGNVTVKPDNSSEENIYDIFIDNWKLLVKDSSDDSELFVFQRNWFTSTMNRESFKTEVNTALFEWGEEACLLWGKPIGNPSCNCFCNKNAGWKKVWDCNDVKNWACMVTGDSWSILECDKVVGTGCMDMIVEVVSCNIADDVTAESGLVWLDNGKKNFAEVGKVEFGACNRIYSWNEVAVWKLLKWNFIVNWSVEWTGGSNTSSIYNKYFIHGKFTTKVSADDLMDVFEWQCINGVDDFDDYCPDSPYQYASLVVIDQNYDSPLFW